MKNWNVYLKMFTNMNSYQLDQVNQTKIRYNKI